MVKEILMLADFSECCKSIVHKALELAEQMSAKVTFMHVVHDPFHWYHAYMTEEDAQEMVVEFEEEGLNKLRALLKAMNSRGVEYDCDIRTGELIEEVLKAIDEKSIDLLVVGKHSSPHLDDFVFGSNTEKLLRAVPVPTVVIRPHTEGSNTCAV